MLHYNLHFTIRIALLLLLVHDHMCVCVSYFSFLGDKCFFVYFNKFVVLR